MKRRNRLAATAFVAVFGMLGACPASAGPADRGDLPALMVRRLEIARVVAWIKFQDRLPVEDPVREAAILAALGRRAQEIGLPPGVAETFFRAQIAASRTVQAGEISRWRRGGPLPVVPPTDLRAVRRELDALGELMLQALRTTRLPDPELARQVRQALRDEHFSTRTSAVAASPLVR